MLIDDPQLAPCRLLEHGDGTHGLCFDDFEPTLPTFEAVDREGGGYSWHGVVDALVRMRAPHLRRKLSYDPEAGMFVAISKDPDALRQVAALILQARSDEDLLREAIANTSKRLAQ